MARTQAAAIAHYMLWSNQPSHQRGVFGIGNAASFGDITETLTVSEISWWNIPLTLTQSGIYAVLAALVAHRMGLQTMTRPPVDEVRREPEAISV